MHFIAGEKAQKVEEVNRLIAHLTAGAAQIVERRHAGGAADHLHQLHPTDRALLQLAAELLMAAVEAPVKADGDRHVQGSTRSTTSRARAGERSIGFSQ